MWTSSKKLSEFKVAVHTSDVLLHDKLIKTHSQVSFTTSCIVTLCNLIELWIYP